MTSNEQRDNEAGSNFGWYQLEEQHVIMSTEIPASLLLFRVSQTCYPANSQKPVNLQVGIVISVSAHLFHALTLGG